MKNALKPCKINDFKAFGTSGRQDSNLRHLAPKAKRYHDMSTFFCVLRDLYVFYFGIRDIAAISVSTF